MIDRGYYNTSFEPFVFRSSCDFYDNYNRPDNQKIRNKVNYLEIYEKKLVSFSEAYVLAKNKHFLIY